MGRVSDAIALLMVLLCAAFAADPYCPAYPTPQRESDRRSLERERAFQSFSRRSSRTPRPAAIERKNFIDDFILGKMEADGVVPAPAATDEEFLRRVYLDITGRIPTVDQARQFLDSPDANKRAQLIDTLLDSTPYIDNFTLFLGNKFEVTSRYYYFVTIQARNRFYAYLRDFVARDRSYADLATELLTGVGDSSAYGPLNYLVRGYQEGDPIQDTWDTLTDRTTVRFLGIKTECISCHNGRRHLEEINLFLTPRRREEFWGMSAFFSRMNAQQVQVDGLNAYRRFIFTERASGAYYPNVSLTNPGPRPPRFGGPYEPKYLMTGEQPKSGEWRRELARILVADRQFARAAVNYVWARFFAVGIVDPPDGWDLSRIDPKNPPPAPWTLQPTHPELLEALADDFISSGYSLKSLIRRIANSSAYQLASTYPGAWRAEYERYVARHLTRRLSPEEIYDAVAVATRTETPMFVSGWEDPVMFANQLPDPSEPRNDFSIRNFMNNFGRGDWFNLPPNYRSNALQVLFLMNDYSVVFRTFATRDGGRVTRVNDLMQSTMSDEEALRTLFLATLSRYASPEEIAAANRARSGTREQWLSDVQWALLNKLEFLFNH
jgi:uncharacterized protein DUF1549/uncharacterized protein DUF1553